MKRWSRWLLAIPFVVPAPSAQAQVALGADFAGTTEYVFRGVTRSTRPAVQAAAFLAWQPAGWTVTGGVWLAVEPFEPRAGDITDAGSDRSLAEADYWVELHTRTRHFDWRLAFIAYDRRGDALRGRRGDAWDTEEVQAGVGLLVTDLLLVSADLAWDVSAIDGGFLALGALQDLALLELHHTMLTAQLAATIGVSIGQEVDSDRPDAPAPFEHGGITHLSSSLALRAHTPRIQPWARVQLQVNADPRTRITAADDSPSTTKLWFDLGVALFVGRLPGAR